jgi:hypothetical protein
MNEVVSMRRILYPAMNLVGVILVLFNYFSTNERNARRRLRWTFLGGAIALIWQAATVNVPRMLGVDLQLDPIVAEAGLFAAPIGIAIGLIWYNTFEIDRLLSQTLAYATVLGLLVLVYELLAYLLSQLLNALGLNASSIVSSILTTSVIAVSFDPVKDRVQAFIDMRFFPDVAQAGDPIDAIAEIGREHGATISRRNQPGEFTEIIVRIPHYQSEAQPPRGGEQGRK